MKIAGLVCFAMLLGATGCRKAGPAANSTTQPANTFSMRGRIVSTESATGHITVSHDEIPGYMPAMTMPYKLAQPNIASELHPGDLITAKVLVDKDDQGYFNPRLDEIVVIGQAKPDYKPQTMYHVPAPGDAVPDFKLLNEKDKTIHLGQFKGKVLLMTFIYTRCPLADYCPRMSANFAQIDQALQGDPLAYAKTHLLSVSFDPKYDTPAVLRSYGGAHTGKFTHETFDHWDFAAPSVAELPDMEHYFDVGVTEGDASAPLQHSLATVLIGKDGKVIAFYPSNDWKPSDVLQQMKQAAL
jgi:protein SCO1/2